MKVSDISTIILKMKGRMPESSRTLLAHHFIRQIALDIKEKNAKLLDEWTNSGGPQKFMVDCDLISDLPFVNHDIAVHDTDLAKFCNRWMGVEKYKDGGEWKPFTAEMHQIRYTIINELAKLAEAQAERGD